MPQWQYRIVHFDTVGQGLNPQLRVYDSEAGEKAYKNPSSKLQYIALMAEYLNMLSKAGWEVSEVISDWKELVSGPLAKGFGISSPTFLLRKEIVQDQ